MDDNIIRAAPVSLMIANCFGILIRRMRSLINSPVNVIELQETKG
jgi:hypothetical protein